MTELKDASTYTYNKLDTSGSSDTPPYLNNHHLRVLTPSTASHCSNLLIMNFKLSLIAPLALALSANAGPLAYGICQTGTYPSFLNYRLRKSHKHSYMIRL